MQKTLGNQHSNRPQENSETKWWRQWLCKIIFGLHHEKKQLFAEVGFSARPISQREIRKEVERRTEMLKQENIWGKTPQFPYRTEHNHNWIERRVNELATEEFGPRTEEETLKIICVDKRKGLYEPNPELFLSEKLP